MAVVNIRDTAQWASLLRASPPRPVLVHLNGDTTWLLQLPIPGSSPHPTTTRFNLLLDPWLQGAQSDVAAWFSTQHHVVAPAVPSLAALQDALRRVAAPADDDDDDDRRQQSSSRIDAVAISHEFTDHCHRATLQELPRDTPVYAPDVAARLIRSWHWFDADAVVTAPGLARDAAWTSLAHPNLPAWLRIGRLVTPGNSLYYHAALVVAFHLDGAAAAEAVVYSPHGIAPRDVAVRDGLATLALLHGLHDVRLSWFKQLNLGALNAVEAVRAARARYWIGTHDEEKTGKGLVAPLLRRTRYSLRQAVAHGEKKKRQTGKAEEEGGYEFRELASGEALLLK